jgi:hypothetical protein
MARTVAELPEGARITDFISLGVISKTFPLETIKKILSQTGVPHSLLWEKTRGLPYEPHRKRWAIQSI